MNTGYTALVIFTWFLSTYFVLVFLFYLIKYRKDLNKSPIFLGKQYPFVSIVVSAYNEEESIEETILSLKELDYPKDKYEIIVINDGSKDGTSEIVSRYADGKFIRFIDNKINKRKAGCLNEGIENAKGEFVACMDADSIVAKDALKKTVPYFKNEKVGAVTVSVYVNNPKTLLDKMVEIEYVIGLSLFLKVFSMFNSIFVTPGPFSVYRKSVLKEIGGFDIHNITEDHEIAFRIHKADYMIENCMTTHVKTNQPKDFRELYIQRRRWYSGALHTLWKHKSMMFEKKHGIFAFFLPFNYALIFLGLSLFGFSTFLMLKNTFQYLSYYSLTNFNFFAHFSLKNYDFLSTSIFSFFGIMGFTMTFMVALIGMKLANKRILKRSKGIFAFIYMFILYQIFWVGSLYNVIRKKNVKWR